MVGHYTDLYEQIIPGTTGVYQIGFVEVGTFIGFAGLFSYIFMRTLGSAALIPQKHPLINESLNHSGH